MFTNRLSVVMSSLDFNFTSFSPYLANLNIALVYSVLEDVSHSSKMYHPLSAQQCIPSKRLKECLVKLGLMSLP